MFAWTGPDPETSSVSFNPCSLGVYPGLGPVLGTSSETEQIRPDSALGMEKTMASHSSILAWKIPGMGEPGGLPSTGSHRVGLY